MIRLLLRVGLCNGRVTNSETKHYSLTGTMYSHNVYKNINSLETSHTAVLSVPGRVFTPYAVTHIINKTSPKQLQRSTSAYRTTRRHVQTHSGRDGTHKHTYTMHTLNILILHVT